jgi:hypothetical protein
MRTNLALIFWVLTTATVARPAFGEDLNIESAQSEYDAKKRVSDAAYNQFNAERSAISHLFSAVERAKNSVNSAEATLTRVRTALDQLDNKIDQNIREVNSKKAAAQNYEETGIRGQDRLTALRDAQERAREALERNEAEITRLKDRIAELEGRTGPEAEAALARVKENLREAVDRRTELKDRIATNRENIETLQRNIADAREAIGRLNNEIRDLNLEVDRLRRDRDQVLIDVRQAQSNLDIERRDLSAAERDLERSRGPYDRAYAQYSSALSATNTAEKYLRQVEANYARAKKRILDAATVAGRDLGTQEGSTKGTADGARKGTSEGKSDGAQKGEADGRLLSFSKGYKDGRANPATSNETLAAFESGKLSGIQWANEKAMKESFPKGFNAAYNEKLASTPVNAETIDISQEISTNVGGQGHDLTGALQSVSSKLPPSFEMPIAPVPSAPSNRQPTIVVPSAGGGTSAAPCNDVPRAEFGPLCREQFRASYVERFELNYRAKFPVAYTPNYNASSAESYRVAFGQNYADSLLKGLIDGARDQGVLKGFAERTAAATQEQLLAGQQDFAAKLSNGFLLVVRSSTLIEADGDDVMVPGEMVKLSMVIDNLGNEASPLGRFQIKVNESINGAELNFEVRDLPALAPNTRTTLVGVVGLKNAAKKSKEKLKLDLSLLRQGTQLMAIESSRETHFPLELVDLKLDRNPRINEKVGTTAVLRNMSNRPQSAENFKIYTSPATIKVDDGSFAVAELAPGASFEKRISLTPGIWVGENLPVDFVSDILDASGQVLSTQIMEKQINIQRSAYLELLDMNGQPLVTPVVVKAGSKLKFRAKLKLNPNQRPSGLFTIRSLAKTSHELIKRTTPSTVGIGPSSSPSPLDVSFDIPASLAGQKGWVMVQLDEGSNIIHAPQIMLEIR